MRDTGGWAPLKHGFQKTDIGCGDQDRRLRLGEINGCFFAYLAPSFFSVEPHDAVTFDPLQAQPLLCLCLHANVGNGITKDDDLTPFVGRCTANNRPAETPRSSNDEADLMVADVPHECLSRKPEQPRGRRERFLPKIRQRLLDWIVPCRQPQPRTLVEEEGRGNP